MECFDNHKDATDDRICSWGLSDWIRHRLSTAQNKQVKTSVQNHAHTSIEVTDHLKTINKTQLLINHRQSGGPNSEQFCRSTVHNAASMNSLIYSVGRPHIGHDSLRPRTCSHVHHLTYSYE